MAEFNLERFKYTWKGQWVSGTTYNRDDVIRINGRSYVCLIGHTAAATFAEDLDAILPGSTPPQPQPRWVVMTAGKSFLGDWTQGTAYVLGDIVLKDGVTYWCKDNHTADVFSNEASNWEKHVSNIAYVGNWTQSTDYNHGAIAKYNGTLYECIVGHTSQTILEDDSSKWLVWYEGIEFRGDYQNGAIYRKNDLVKYGGTILRCITSHTAASDDVDDAYFTVEIPGYQFDGVYTPGTVYNIGDVVSFGGYLYFASSNSKDISPDSDDSSNPWTIFATSNQYREEWENGRTYNPGDVVLRGGETYVAKSTFVTEEGDYSDTDKWELQIPGVQYKGRWGLDIHYGVGSIVYYLGSAYKCNTEHQSHSTNWPGDNGNGFYYWDLLIQAGSPAGMYDQGDMLTYGLYRELADDGSSLGDTALPIGTTSQVLSVSADLEAYWRETASDAEVFHVAPNGIDEPDRGSPEKPLRTVRFACDLVEDTLDPMTPAKVAVATGRYNEIGPITVPAGCVVMGDELRATVVEAGDPITEYANAFNYVPTYLLHLTSLLDAIANNDEITPTDGNTESQIFTGKTGSSDATNAVAANFTVYEQYLDFTLNGAGSQPTVTGSNDLSTDDGYINTADNLLANRKFLAEEIYAYLVSLYGEIFNQTYIKNDVYAIIRGVARDLKYVGNEFTIKSAIRFINAKNGSRLSDLFRMRDTTGLRNMTIEGLQGDLNPPGVYDLYQRPTGGACVALDPGFGPDDEKTWIVQRSPYIQGVTNIGSYCVGKRVDGSLHNGGNKSMVSNDFTQVLSDGVGVWVSNNARVELVSIFTYYCQVGYLAETGGVIRSAQGNNSYGSFGSIADGNDPTETPESITINNRENEAQVEDAFAGGNNDEFLVFEYSNCGQNYTEASASIVGAGALAAVEYDDFRTGGVFEARLVNTSGSGSEGGSNYLLRSGSAQITADSTSTIRLAAADPTQFLSEIENMRIVIQSGQGFGQYGYIAGFDPVTMDVTVRRESDGELGWDHVIPGTAIETSLDSTATYRIEPKLAANDPGFSAVSRSLPNQRDYKDIAFGYTTVTYNNIAVDNGSGETYDADPIPARFNVVRQGPEYVVTINTAGAGYAANDVLTITGDLLGGATPANDLQIIVTEATDDSTASIVSFTSSGTPRGKRFIAIADPNFLAYSDDGENFTELNLPEVNDYKKIIAGMNRFIAVGANNNTVQFSYDGETWVTRALPSSANWIDAAYGNDLFVLIADDTNEIAYSTDGLSWSSANIPDNTLGDSTISQWQGIAYGQGRFVAIAGSDRAAAYSTNGASWTRVDTALPDADYDFAACAYGDNRFVGMTKSGATIYSLDKGESWTTGGTLPNDGSIGDWNDLKYGNGVFFAIGLGPADAATNYCATSDYGIIWTEKTLDSNQEWTGLVNSDINDRPTWVLISQNSTSQGVNQIVTGRTAQFRASISEGSFDVIKIWDPGSGYNDDENPCIITVTDTQFVTEVEIDTRHANNVLAQPSFVNRGSGYRTSSSTVTITGDGFADIIPESNEIVVDGIATVPGPGAQLRFVTIPDPDTPDVTDYKLFTGVAATDLGDDGSGNNTRTVRFTISPRMRNEYNLEHGTEGTMRVRYSQCRISGHDFLDIGTGNFEETNYPELYAGGAYFEAAPENEVLEANGGRVFYTSTDQNGNFRTGELFSVQQSTGIVTISAEFFDLDGLSELSLGGVRLGGSGAVVSEFSTDPTFSADSNNVVPTQRAIATFLADRLSVGGENLETNTIVAGRVRVGTENNIIETTTATYLYFNRDVDISGQDDYGNDTAIDGTMIANMLFLKTTNETIQ